MLSAIRRWVEVNTERATWQLERGEQTGYDHMQITVTLKKKQRLSWFKHHLSPQVHAEVTRNIEASFDYCMKSETRIAGPWSYPRPLPKKVVDPLHDKTLYHWQQEIINLITAEPHPRYIYWYWEPTGGVGKTDFIKHVLLNYDAKFFQGAKRDIAYAYNGQEICLFGFSRTTEGKISYDSIESLKDGLIFSGKYESDDKVYNRPHVICFANWEPEVDAISLDRWIIKRI